MQKLQCGKKKAASPAAIKPHPEKKMQRLVKKQQK
jgi:hypothetical protein